MTDKDDVAEIECMNDLQHIPRVSVQFSVARRVVRGEIGLSRSDVIHENYAIITLEFGSDKSPHVLVAAEPVGEHHRLCAAAEDFDVVPANYVLTHVFEAPGR